jgi:hypothetical protein
MLATSCECQALQRGMAIMIVYKYVILYVNVNNIGDASS